MTRERERECRREGGYAKVLQWVLIPRDKYVLFFGVEKLNRKIFVHLHMSQYEHLDIPPAD